MKTQRHRRGVLATMLAMTLAALTPWFASAQSANGGWQVYTTSNGMNESTAFSIAPDGSGGVWIGHISGGRGIGRRGGLEHIAADGTTFTNYSGKEPFASCSSIDNLALAPNGTMWIRASGYHDYGSPDYFGQCSANYGISGDRSAVLALGTVGSDGTVQMLPKDQLPAAGLGGAGLAVDAQNRPWIGSAKGLLVREANGTWRAVDVWAADQGTTWTIAASDDGTRIALGSHNGNIAIVTLISGQPEGIAHLPRPDIRPGQQVNDLAFASDALLAAADRFYLFTNNTWVTHNLPGTDPANDGTIFGARVAAVGGTYWASAYGGVGRLDGSTWRMLRAGETPLPYDGVTDLASWGTSRLLLTTFDGAAQYDITAAPADTSATRQSFDRLWQRTNVNSQGNWVWGPRAWNERYEAFAEMPGGNRFVRYYDKTRMEQPLPNADPNSSWYVTNGLLVKEMVTGIRQSGFDETRGSCPFFYNYACPARQQVAGDLSADRNQLTVFYSDFTDRLGRVESRVGGRVSATLTRAQSYDQVNPGDNASFAGEATTIDTYDETTGHNIPRVFARFMQQQTVDALYAFGHPISEPYWVQTDIGGVNKWVMVQLFERRTLTYTPSNDPAWQVEMGNVGQHYYAWRYLQSGSLPRPWE